MMQSGHTGSTGTVSGFRTLPALIIFLLFSASLYLNCSPPLDISAGGSSGVSIQLTVAAVFLDASVTDSAPGTNEGTRFLLPESQQVNLVIVNAGNNTVIATPTVIITQATDTNGHLLLSGRTDSLALPTGISLRFSATISGTGNQIIASAATETILTAGNDINISLFLLPTTDHPALVELNDSNLPDIVIPGGQSRILKFDAPPYLVGRLVGVGFRVAGDASKLRLAMRNASGSAGSGFTYKARVGVHWVLPAAGIYYLITHNSGTADLALLDFNFNDTISPAIGNMRYVSNGSFQRDSNPDNISWVSTFLMSQYEITRAQYLAVMSIDPSLLGNSTGLDDPVQNVSWYETLVFCNKLSLLEGLTPVYSLTPGGSRNPADWGAVPNLNNADWNSMYADWMADGYRLPTNMEFIWASIGIKNNTGTSIDGRLKAFAGDDLGTAQPGDYAWYGYGAGGNATEMKTRPGGLFRPNDLTIYDLSGNVNEWCWDGFGSLPMGPLQDYRGTFGSAIRVRRGGSWSTPAANLLVGADSDISASAEQKYGSMGFRVVRRPVEVNNYLSSLIPGAGQLEPVFKPENQYYMVQLENSFGSLILSASAFAAAEGATVSYSAGNPAILSVGRNELTVTVNNPRTGPRQYHITVYRGAPGEVLANKAGLLVPVPAGSFQYDNITGNNHSSMQDLYFGKFEVTRNLFKSVMNEDPSVGSDSLGLLAPAHYTSWYHAIAFCNRLSLQEGFAPVYTISGSTNPNDWGAVPPTSPNAAWDAVTANWLADGYRLPTEMEWMWAAMGGNSGYGYSPPIYLDGYLKAFAGSDGMNFLDDYAWYDGNSGYKIRPVGSRIPNELGLYDMSGSISEWCWDWYDAYPGGAMTEYRGAGTGTNRVRRGGTYNIMSTQCTVAFRAQYAPGSPDASIGFRVVRNKP